MSAEIGSAGWLGKYFGKSLSLELGSLTLFDLTLSRLTYSIPKPPSGLTAEMLNGDILLKWQDNSTRESGYEVWRKEGNGDFQLITTRDEDFEAYIDESFNMNSQYTYKVRAYNEPEIMDSHITVSPWTNYSDYSNTVTITPNNTNENPTVSKVSGPDNGSVITQNSATFVWSGSDQDQERSISRYQY